MEKQHNLKNRILKILPKAAAAVRVTFQNPPFSPGRDHHTKRLEHGSRWSKQRGGSMVSMIPDEARTKAKHDAGSTIDSREPTSPKVSCMGQIKHKKKQIKKAKAKSMSLPEDAREVKENSSAFHGAKRSASGGAPPTALGAMKRFASGSNYLTEFDWKVHAPAADMDQNGYFSDQDRGDSAAEDEEVIIPFSAPIMPGDGCHGEGVPYDFFFITLFGASYGCRYILYDVNFTSSDGRVFSTYNDGLRWDKNMNLVCLNQISPPYSHCTNPADHI